MNDDEGPLIRASTDALAVLEQSILRHNAFTGGISTGDKAVSYFLLTGDVSSGLYYAPVHNLSDAALESAGLSRAGDSVLSTIRDKFFLAADRSSPIQKLYEELTKLGPDMEVIGFAPIDANGSLKNVQCYGQDGRDLELSLRTPTERLADKTMGAIDQLQKAIGTDGPLRVAVVIRVDPFDPQNRARLLKLQLFQIGLLIIGGDEEIGPIISLLWRMLNLSSYATLSLHYERERYFYRAARQAQSGKILKTGRKDDLDPEIDLLGKLASNSQYVPTIYPQNSIDKQPHGISGWYTMSRITLPTLAETFATNGGFNEFEVKAVIRSCFENARQASRWSEQTDTHRAFPCLAVPVLDCIDEFFLCRTALNEAYDATARQRPELLNYLTGEAQNWKNIRLELLWANGSTETIVDCAPVEILRAVLRNCASLQDEIPVLGAVDHLHGDLHFRNILVDLSVPEDALTFLIDPKSRRDWDPRQKVDDFVDSDVLGEGRNSAILSAVPHYRGDPLYDIAKLLFSCSGGYSMVDQGVLRAGSTKDGFTLAAPSDVGLEPLRGGASGSRVYRVGARVHQDVWGNFRVASEMILELTAALMQRALRGKSSAIKAISINVSLLRLWIMTARHCFSISRNMFPDNTDSLLPMFLLGCRILAEGREHAYKILEDPTSEALTKEFRSRLQWPQLQNRS